MKKNRVMNFGDLLAERDVVHSSGDLFGMNSDYLSLFLEVTDTVNCSKKFNQSYNGLVSLMRSYFRHLNTLNLLTQYSWMKHYGNEINMFQDGSRVSFELSVYLYYLLYDLDLLERKSEVYEASAYQFVAKFFQHFGEMTYSYDESYVEQIKSKVNIDKYLHDSRVEFASKFSKVHFEIPSIQYPDNNWDRNSHLWYRKIDSHKWYDDGTNWNSFYSLVAGLSENNPFLMANYYLVYVPCCTSVHSNYSSNYLDLTFTGLYPQVTSSDQDLSAYWMWYFKYMLVWVTYRLSLVDSDLFCYFTEMKKLFNRESQEFNDHIIITNDCSLAYDMSFLLKKYDKETKHNANNN